MRISRIISVISVGSVLLVTVGSCLAYATDSWFEHLRGTTDLYTHQANPSELKILHDMLVRLRAGSPLDEVREQLRLMGVTLEEETQANRNQFFDRFKYSGDPLY